eukprot:11166622-Lingulodinium_polyedra.AAC.1
MATRARTAHVGTTHNLNPGRPRNERNSIQNRTDLSGQRYAVDFFAASKSDGLSTGHVAFNRWGK